MTIKVKLGEPSRNKSGYVVKDHNKVTISRKKKTTKINDDDDDGGGVGSRRRRLVKSTQVAPLPVPPTLQRLYEACRDAFQGPGTVPTPSHVHKLSHIIDGMLPEDVGLSREIKFFKSSGTVKGVPRVTSTTIYECTNFSLCIFFLPATGVIPLHNHPGMTVLSKLLLGTMHIKAYDLVDPIDSDGSTPQSKLKLARLKADSVFTSPCDSTSVLYPTSGGNIHAFTAITPCAVLDVIGPPYSKADGRDGSYYKDTPYSALSKNLDGGSMIAKEEGHLYGWLEEIEMPEESEMDAIRYLGPQINEATIY